MVKFKVRSQKLEAGAGSGVVGRFRTSYFSLLTFNFLAAAALVAATPGQSPQQAPVFRAGVDLVAVEVQVVDKNNQPVQGLDLTKFDVRIDGHKRRVSSANFIDFSQSLPVPPGTTLPTIATPLGPLPVASATERTFVLAVDEMSFREVAARTAISAAQNFVDHLRPEDLVGVFPYPTMPKTLDLTHRHVAVRQALQGLAARGERPYSEFHMSPSEVVDITSADRDVFNEVVTRECDPADLNCPERVHGEATQLAGYYEADTGRRVMSLRLLLESLARLPSRKTLVIVSGGLISADRTVGRPDVSSMTSAIGKEAAVANTNLYVLHVDQSFFEATSASTGNRSDWDDSFRDSILFGLGLERVAGAAGGAYLRTQSGAADHVFNRVLKESSGHYLIGVEPSAEDRDGRLHSIRVKVAAPKSTVRSRTYVIIPKPRPMK